MELGAARNRLADRVNLRRCRVLADNGVPERGIGVGDRANQHQRHLRGGHGVRVGRARGGCIGFAEQVRVDDRAHVHGAGRGRRAGGGSVGRGCNAVPGPQQGPCKLHQLPGEQDDQQGGNGQRQELLPPIGPGALGDRGDPAKTLIHAQGQLHQVSCKCPSGKAVPRDTASYGLGRQALKAVACHTDDHLSFWAVW